MANEELQSMAIQVLVDFANHLTDLRKTGRSDIILSAFCFAQSQRLDGGENQGEDEDYCACNEKVKSELRARMVCTYSNLSVQIPVQERLPAGTFPGGFISDLMMNSSSFCKRKCNFVSHGTNAKPGFYKEGHDVSTTAKGISENLKAYSVEEKTVIIDNVEQLESLKILIAGDLDDGVTP
jgi:hypothetical protein